MHARIESWEQAGDRRAVFLSCYQMMTRNVLAAITDGDFEDGSWVSILLHHFAEYYFEALQAYERHEGGAPAVWEFVFEAARQPNMHVLQDLVLGVNAHINYDLVFALADLLGPEWAALSPEQRQARYRDHCHVNDIINHTIDSVQDQVIERQRASMDLVDKMLGPLDEWLISRLVVRWRDEVWDDATHFIETSAETDREALRRQVEQRSLDRARFVAGEQGLAGLLDLF
jgi:hypothetical protein